MPPDGYGSGLEILERAEPRTLLSRRLVVGVTALVVLIALVALGVGVARAPGERQALNRCAERASASVEKAERRMASLTSYLAGSLVGAPPLLSARLIGLISQEASGQRQPVEAALRTCRDIEVWPLNGSNRDVRAAYIAFLEAESDRLEAITADGSKFFTGYDEVRTRALAAEALLSP